MSPWLRGDPSKAEENRRCCLDLLLRDPSSAESRSLRRWRGERRTRPKGCSVRVTSEAEAGAALFVLLQLGDGSERKGWLDSRKYTDPQSEPSHVFVVSCSALHQRYQSQDPGWLILESHLCRSGSWASDASAAVRDDWAWSMDVSHVRDESEQVVGPRRCVVVRPGSEIQMRNMSPLSCLNVL